MTPHTGPAFLYVRSSKYNHSSMSTHITDLHEVLKTDMENSSHNSFVLLSDGGPDFSPSSVLNHLFLFRLFKVLHLDMLSVSTYAARYSAFNPIEHLWSVMSNKLSGVVFSPTLEGESKPPLQQTNLLPPELVRKEKQVFDAAMNELKNYWKEVKFDDFDVTTRVVLTNEDELLFDDHDNVKKFLACPIRDIHRYEKISNEYKLMFKHVDRHFNEVVFMKCDDRRCCMEWKSESLKNFFSRFSKKLFAPESTKIDGHFDTFLQSCIKAKNVYGSDGQPSCSKITLGNCGFCPNYQFKSKTEKERHISMFHRRQKLPEKSKEFKCNVCEAGFSSLSSLNRHKKNQKHTARDQPASLKRKKVPLQQRSTKRRSIGDMLRAMENTAGDEDDDENDEKCSAQVCSINDFQSSDVFWVACEICSLWFHVYCVTKDKEKEEIEDFVCCSCK